MIELHNEELAGRLESQEPLLNEIETEKPEAQLIIDPANLAGNINGPAKAEAAYLVDMAKAEALSLMGETKKGLEFAPIVTL